MEVTYRGPLPAAHAATVAGLGLAPRLAITAGAAGPALGLGLGLGLAGVVVVALRRDDFHFHSDYGRLVSVSLMGSASDGLVKAAGLKWAFY